MFWNIEFVFEDMDTVYEFIRLIEPNLTKPQFLRPFLSIAGQKAINYVRPATPVKSGFLRDSNGFLVSNDYVDVFNTAEYAAEVEARNPFFYDNATKGLNEGADALISYIKSSFSHLKWLPVPQEVQSPATPDPSSNRKRVGRPRTGRQQYYTPKGRRAKNILYRSEDKLRGKAAGVTAIDQSGFSNTGKIRIHKFNTVRHERAFQKRNRFKKQKDRYF